MPIKKKKRREPDIYSREILRTLQKYRRPLSTREISQRADMHWKTTRDRLMKLQKRGLVNLKVTGTRRYRGNKTSAIARQWSLPLFEQKKKKKRRP